MASYFHRATLNDVAATAGVSTATVSRVLNKTAYVSPKTKKLVKAAVIKVGYEPNAAGRALALGQSESIAVLITEKLVELLTDPTYGVVLQGIQDTLEETNYLPVIIQAHSLATQKRALKHFAAKRVDAVIHLSAYKGTEVLKELANFSLPVVLCGQPQQSDYNRVFTHIYADDTLGAELAAKHLLTRKTKTIAIVNGPKSNPAAVDRLKGYSHALGIAYQKNLTIHTGWDYTSGKKAIKILLKQNPNIDGVLAASDRLAAGVITGLKEAGKSVPKDVAVIGFDDHKIAKELTPSLTTIKQPLYKQGELAAKKAINMIKGEKPKNIILTDQLVIRNSA